jgi:copper chaperone
MKTIMFRVKGMHCSSCEMLICDALEDLGVKESKANKDKATVKVYFDEEKIKPNKIREVIEKEGYKVITQKMVGGKNGDD